MLSIVTPTFNRAKLLKNCFLSLQRQTNQDFEWIVVDDGSVDDTKAVVASFQEQAPEMRITYIYKENGGKHTALNASHPYLHGYPADPVAVFYPGKREEVCIQLPYRHGCMHPRSIYQRFH